MKNLSKLQNVIGLVYDSVVDDDKWSEALNGLAEFTGGHGAFYLVADPRCGDILHSESVGVDPLVNQRYLQYYAAKEVRIPPALRFPVGTVFVEEMLLERRTLRRSEIYGELLGPFDIPHVMAVWIRKEVGAFANVVVEGSHNHGPFSSAERERFDLVVPHLVRAARMRDIFLLARQSRRAYLEVLRTLPFGVVLLDGSGEVVEATPPAEQVLRRGAGLRLSQRRLCAGSRDDDRRLQAALHAARNTQRGESIPGETVVIQRSVAESPLSVTIIPLSPHELIWTAPETAALVLILDPDATPQPSSRHIQRVFGLTNAEASLAACLFGGSSLREGATVLGRSVNTCKSQLKSIYRKTGCRHHAELAKKLLVATLVSPRYGPDHS